MRDGTLGVVAGVDGSDTSIMAARWALEEARRRGVGLTLVYVWSVGLDIAYPPFDNLGVEAQQALGQRTLDDVAKQVSPDDRVDALIRTVVIEGIPGPTLVDQAADAELLVLGSHGRGPLLRGMLGSVSTYCVHHAQCSTVIVPAAAMANAS